MKRYQRRCGFACTVIKQSSLSLVFIKFYARQTSSRKFLFCSLLTGWGNLSSINEEKGIPRHSWQLTVRAVLAQSQSVATCGDLHGNLQSGTQNKNSSFLVTLVTQQVLNYPTHGPYLLLIYLPIIKCSHLCRKF